MAAPFPNICQVPNFCQGGGLQGPYYQPPMVAPTFLPPPPSFNSNPWAAQYITPYQQQYPMSKPTRGRGKNWHRKVMSLTSWCVTCVLIPFVNMLNMSVNKCEISTHSWITNVWTPTQLMSFWCTNQGANLHFMTTIMKLSGKGSMYPTRTKIMVKFRFTRIIFA